MWSWSPQMHQKSGLQLLPHPSPSSFLRWTDSIVNIFVPSMLQKHTLPSIHRYGYSVYAYSWNLGTLRPSRKTASASSCCCSVAKSCLVLCLPHGLQQARLLCPSLSSGACSNLCPFNQGCSNHLILCSLLLLLPSIFPSIRVFSQESALHIRWSKDWCFGLNIQWILGLISFMIDLLDLLAVQGTLKSLLQHHDLKASILRHSVSFSTSNSLSFVYHIALSHSLSHHLTECGQSLPLVPKRY